MTDEYPTIKCVFTNEDTLYAAYMPFVKGGGLFIRSKHDYPLGSILNLSIQLMDDDSAYELQGKVIWITPKGAQGGKPSGVGVQFISEDSRLLTTKIEICLAGILKSARTSDTI